ncbi:hypothetical protein QNH39_22830 [Neobacillus novalis]|uniref:Uncharacterized protein n=1 Tax=Neobacillus novalis TaxID=220687 RepID=A0AA95SK00_9BACI|nr:hypothetical protein [Neobacillus novalis]WHY89171.1 hypothetical protein QNH39_22830 [Neobacillus novalis]
MITMLIGAEGGEDSCGSSGTGETPQAFTPRRLTAHPAESEAAWSGNQHSLLTQPFN